MPNGNTWCYHFQWATRLPFRARLHRQEKNDPYAGFGVSNPPRLSSAPFCSGGLITWLWLSLLTFTIRLLVGKLSVRRYRHDRIARAQRRLQLSVLSLELKSLRSDCV